MDCVRSAAYQYILEGRYGNVAPIVDKKGNQTFWRVAASNSEQDFCAVNQTSLALLRRFCHLQVNPELGEIMLYFLNHSRDSRVIAYLQNFPEDLFPKKWTETLLDNKANPFPYTWEVVALLIKDIKDAKSDIFLNLVASCVGPEVAIRFAKYCQLTDKVDMAKILAEPKIELDKLKENQDSASLYYAIIANFAAMWFKKEKKLDANKVVQISGALPHEFTIAFLQMILVKREKELLAVKGFEAFLRTLGMYFGDENENDNNNDDD